MSEAVTNVEQLAKQFIEYVLTQLVEEQAELTIEAKTDELGVLVSVKVGTNDMGKIIGKNGQTIQALRVLLRILGGNLNQRINLKIIEPSSPTL